MSKMTTLILGFLVSATLPVGAEIISIVDPNYSVANDVTGVIRPTRGMSMNAVASQYGQAATQSAAIGQPPISKWTYPNFIVFFEYSTVIHAVVPH